MGDEIFQTQFSADVYEEFRSRLDMETAILQAWIDEGCLHCDEPWAGAELEAWLVGDDANPSPSNDAFLESLDDPLVVRELAKFNIELNTDPLEIKSGFLERMHDNMLRLWRHCQSTAEAANTHVMMTGILPTVREANLCMDNQSNMNRYRALNQQIFRLRNGVPIHLDITGREKLELDHYDVMLEAAATSFQIHYKCDIDMATHAYNASRILSGPMVAVGANSPYLFGHDLWAETRIPLFEQSVQVGGSAYSNRVSFGLHHVSNSILDCFEANRTRYPLLLPQLMDTPPEALAHLRLHNGTIWRWNRPLIGFDNKKQPHVRIEHRVVAAGPTMRDVVANAALYFGALTALLENTEWIEQSIPNRSAARNFYQCAEHGLEAEVVWKHARPVSVAVLILENLLPLAERGLISIGYTKAEVDDWLSIIAQRVKTRLNGAAWQRQWVAQYGKDFQGLTHAYLENQDSNSPVHTWRL